METKGTKFLLIFAMLISSTLLGMPSKNTGPGCVGCHSLNNGIVSVTKLDSVTIQVLLTGVTTGKKVAGEIVNSAGVVVDYINSTSTNPFILKAYEAGEYIVNAGFKSPSLQWDSVSVNMTGGDTGNPDSGWSSKIKITEIMFDVPKDALGDANGDGNRGSRSDEFVELYNSDSVEVDISGYEILDREKIAVFTFPPNTIISPDQYAVVFGAIGTSGYGNHIPLGTALFAVQKNDDANVGFNNGMGKSNFSNSGDCVVLVNPALSDTLAEIYWGSATPVTTKPIYLGLSNTKSGAKISGAIGMSVTRTLEDSLWDTHIFVSEDTTSLFSPGWDVTTITDIKTQNQEQNPSVFVLNQNYPNPFNPSTIIRFSLPESGLVSLKVFNILGQEVTTLINEVKPVGTYEVSFDASNLSTGMYIYRIQSASFTATKKMLLIK